MKSSGSCISHIFIDIHSCLSFAIFLFCLSHLITCVVTHSLYFLPKMSLVSLLNCVFGNHLRRDLLPLSDILFPDKILRQTERKTTRGDSYFRQSI